MNQDAVFRDRIAHKDGLSIKLEGNIFKDVGSPHYNAHQKLEEFWNLYRKKGDFFGEIATIAEYNQALKESLIHAGLSESQVNKTVTEAMNQQIGAGFSSGDFVPRIPGRINLPKPKLGG
ncbi:type IV secretion protein Rhs [Listeria portnoyi]|uniref:type IV secretion protein Rhs n=1 Tax=Listeria portnoyi TaxID=2713504 RepID=UPI00164E676C|nr:type IV secretion protein Rhs [Listeria portnoyi]